MKLYVMGCDPNTGPTIDIDSVLARIRKRLEESPDYHEAYHACERDGEKMRYYGMSFSINVIDTEASYMVKRIKEQEAWIDKCKKGISYNDESPSAKHPHLTRGQAIRKADRDYLNTLKDQLKELVQ